MQLKIKENTAKKLYPESPGWFKEVLTETFGKKTFIKDFRDIKTMEDVYEVLEVHPSDVYHDNDSSDVVAYKKLTLIVKAINQGWEPDWDNTNERKWWPWFRLSSGFGFGYSDYYCTSTGTSVGSRLCFQSEEKSDHAAKQFIDVYKAFLTKN